MMVSMELLRSCASARSLALSSGGILVTGSMPGCGDIKNSLLTILSKVRHERAFAGLAGRQYLPLDCTATEIVVRNGRMLFSGCDHPTSQLVKASDTRVFCSISWAPTEPVAGLALGERFTERTGRGRAMRRNRGIM